MRKRSTSRSGRSGKRCRRRRSSSRRRCCSTRTEAAALEQPERSFFAAFADAAERDRPRGGDAWQTLLFAIAKACDLPAPRAFGAIYRAFLGRENGPRAGWLLAGLDPAFVVERLRAAARGAG